MDVSRFVKIGSGGNAHVFKIPCINDYVIRILKHDLYKPVTESFAAVADDFPNKNFGQKIGAIGHLQILKRQNGEPLITASKELRADKPKLERIYIRQLEDLAALPQESYDDFIKNIQLVNSKGYKIDPSKANNFLLDKENKAINIVDLNKYDASSMTTFSDAVVPLVNNICYNQIRPARNPEIIEKYAKIVVQKALESAKKFGMDVKPGSSLEYSFRIAGLENSYAALAQLPV